MAAKNQSKNKPRPMTATLLALAVLGAALVIASPAAADTYIDSAIRPTCVGASTGGNCYGYYQPGGVGSQGTCVGLYVNDHCTGVQT